MGCFYVQKFTFMLPEFNKWTFLQSLGVGSNGGLSENLRVCGISHVLCAWWKHEYCVRIFFFNFFFLAFYEIAHSCLCCAGELVRSPRLPGGTGSLSESWGMLQVVVPCPKVCRFAGC